MGWTAPTAPTTVSRNCESSAIRGWIHTYITQFSKKKIELPASTPLSEREEREGGRGGEGKRGRKRGGEERYVHTCVREKGGGGRGGGKSERRESDMYTLTLTLYWASSASLVV